MPGKSKRRVKTPDGRPFSRQPKWRHDFPIEVVEDSYVSRRDFTKFLGLTSLAFVAGQLFIGFKNLFLRGRGKLPSVQIAGTDDIPVGGTLRFQYPGENDYNLLMRTGPDTYRAYSQKCTHLSCAVTPNVAAGTLHCPCHDGVFDLATGRPLAGPPRRPLPRITLQVRDGKVFATGVEVRST